MASVTKITLTYEEKRLQNYQSVGHAVALEIVLEPGDDIDAVIGKYRDIVKNDVSAYVEAEIDRVANESYGGRR